MLRHARQAVPWRLVAAATVLGFGLLVLVRWRPWTLWPLEGVAVGLLAAVTGWCLDEPAAAVVDATPKGSAWRTAARATGPAVLLAGWASGVWWARAALFGHPWQVLLQGVGAVAVGFAWVVLQRTRGRSVPGGRWATAVVPAVTAWALVRPLSRVAPVFPFGYDAAWAGSALGWAVATGAALGALAAALVIDGRTPA